VALEVLLLSSDNNPDHYYRDTAGNFQLLADYTQCFRDNDTSESPNLSSPTRVIGLSSNSFSPENTKFRNSIKNNNLSPPGGRAQDGSSNTNLPKKCEAAPRDAELTKKGVQKPEYFFDGILYDPESK
jgi:hypothetical protein